ncbi:MBL fold metallo-hydrolase [Pseudomonas sp. LS44]|uniref:alkyl sulfatase dimerization domain-containing protein n=1 Tax=Pseudomonas sp. LS44 TaxID=1357074 RepID=UPI00215ADEC2|nr:alkyl sulfatase dimerization domain-containing protein [Pseudomonas sp. LS44]UVE17465.1 MBL fold metallo-hydrolase [Pseudomonas sp. LS44]
MIKKNYKNPLLLMGLVLFSGASSAATETSKPDVKAVQRFELRSELMAQYPGVLNALQSNANAGFGGPQSAAIANHMYSRTNQAAIDDARAKLVVEPHGKGTWLLRFPYVNVAVFETSEGLVLVDSGYAPAGPALVEALRKISNKPVNTVIVTHHHADHGFGTWALLKAGENPRIITTETYLSELALDIKTANYSIVRLNNQDPRDVPRRMEDTVLPTETFQNTKTLVIGGEEFVLTHARGESADQLWVNVPSRKIVVSADYWQPFLLNAGNGKRRQRYVAEWAQALRDMAGTKPELVLPMHGAAMTSPAEAQDKLLASADMLDSAVTQVIDGLNANKRPDEIVASVKLPERLQGRADMVETYNRFQNVASMVLKEYGGWWDGIPSDWDPAPRSDSSKELVEMSGGIDKVTARIRVLLDVNPALACQLADIAYFAAPDNADVLQVAMDAYAKRIVPGIPTQELTVYMEHMLSLKQRQKALADNSALVPKK